MEHDKETGYTWGSCSETKVPCSKFSNMVFKTLPHAICTELCIFACIPVQTYQAESDAMSLCITGICRYAAFWKRKQMYSLALDIGVLVLWDFGA